MRLESEQIGPGSPVRDSVRTADDPLFHAASMMFWAARRASKRPELAADHNWPRVRTILPRSYDRVRDPLLLDAGTTGARRPVSLADCEKRYRVSQEQYKVSGNFDHEQGRG
jgi:hypothetical protein